MGFNPKNPYVAKARGLRAFVSYCRGQPFHTYAFFCMLQELFDFQATSYALHWPQHLIGRNEDLGVSLARKYYQLWMDSKL